ncbi:MAG TPA: hypothetical protein VHM19_01840 [Polyangiales bacterium]|jgi:hypothetical protein|nr:hypothetical protein [Polyangiales bacterium]
MSARAKPFVLLSLLVLPWAALGCAPEIGDECGTALDCSASATRICDRTQPHGYCTLQGCEKGACPAEAVCVKFSPSSERLATTYCMYKCDDSGDCREDQGYKCLRAMPASMSKPDPYHVFGDGIEAEVLGNPNQKFCAVRSELPSPDAGVDAGK